MRVREFFLELARKDPARWLVIENNDQPLWALEQRILDAVLARLEGKETQVRRIAPEPLPRPAASIATLEEQFFGALDELELREPALAVFLLTGIPGLLAQKRRLAASEQFPALVARSLSGLHDTESDALREILADRAPVEVLESLGRDPGPRAMRLRTQPLRSRPRGGDRRARRQRLGRGVGAAPARRAGPADAARPALLARRPR